MQQHYFSSQPTAPAKPRLIAVELAGRQLEVQTAAGVFSSDAVDRGTRVLLENTQAKTTGNILDLGCGWGPISITTALQAPDSTVWALDVNARALELTAVNAARLGLTNVQTVTAEQLPPTVRFTQIRSNPPIRVGKAVLHQLMHTWLPRLEPGGVCEMVVAKNLGAVSFEKWLADTFGATHSVARIARDKGFHVLKVTRL